MTYEPSQELIDFFRPKTADDRELIRAWLVANHNELDVVFLPHRRVRPDPALRWLRLGLLVTAVFFLLGFLVGVLSWR